MSHASAISSPPPSAWPAMYAMNTCGAAAIRRNAAWLTLIISMFAPTSPSRNFLMSAPAEKNFSLALWTIDDAGGADDGLVDRARELGHELEVVGVGRRLVERDEAERPVGCERDSHQYASPPTTTDLIST